MTAVLIVGIYLFALACFLGLDVIARLPPNLYAAVIATLGTLGGVVVLAGLGRGGPPSPLMVMAAGCAGVAVGAGLMAAVRLRKAFERKARP